MNPPTTLKRRVRAGDEQAQNETWVLVLTAVASLMVALDALVVSTALTTIRHDLHASIGDLEWTLNAYALSFAVLLISASALGDRLGRRRTFAAGLGLFVASSAGCALAPGIGWLIAARTVQGGAAAVIAPLSLSLLSAAIPAPRRGRAMGIYSGITGVAVLAGPVLGGAVTQGLAWPWVFWLNVPIGLIAIPLVMTRLRESHGPRRRFDARGMALVTAGATGLVWGLMRGNQIGWGSAETIVALAGGALLAGAFVGVELSGRDPMLPPRLFVNRGFAAGSAAIFMLTASLFGAVFFIAQFLQVCLHDGPLAAGVRMLPWTATLFVVAPLAGSLVNRVGERVLVATGLLLQGIGLGWIALVAGAHMPYGELIAPLVISGTGTSMAMPATQTVVVSAVAGADLGAASGAFTMMRQLGGVFGIAVIVAVFTSAGSYLSPGAFAAGFAAAMGGAAVLAAAGAVAGLALPARQRLTSPAPPPSDGRTVPEPT